MSKLTSESNDFFQTPNHNFSNPKDDKWYKNTPVGVDTIGKFMACISEHAQLSKCYTNHKIKGTIATAMKKAGHILEEIAFMTKHKDLEGKTNHGGKGKFLQKLM